MNAAHLLLLAALLPQLSNAQTTRDQASRLVRRPNVLILLGDDMGVDMVACYAEGSAPPCTPNIDGLATRGLLFRNAWANPTCSPTRSELLTGRYGFRTGIGRPVNNSNQGLLLSEFTLPEMLTGYSSSVIGKWHLAGQGQSKKHPGKSGFGYHAGSMGNISDYFNWQKVVNGSESTSTTYATTDCADEAIQAALTMPEPWLLYTAFQAPHTPHHVPPSGLCACPTTSNCDVVKNGSSKAVKAKAMTEAMDTEIGRLLQVISPNTLVIFMGDNGTAATVTEPPFNKTQAKGTLYEGGVNVPLIIAGAGTVQGECGALVTATDIFATLGDLARVPSSAEDSVSLVPYLWGSSKPQRDVVYAEFFTPNGPAPWTTHTRAVRDDRFKLIRSTGVADEFYDLQSDPFEQIDLFPSIGPGSPLWSPYHSLVAELVKLGVG
ncbi:MAG: sulfatase-like hydrolase/transferase [Planctomycetota bacterium]|jgi:arylsulfatase A-like enzyme|nr:sulfatase-like hydrolase/transferase [Planctomycetota bacterium]